MVNIQDIIKLMNTKVAIFFGAVTIVFVPPLLAVLGVLFDDTSKGYYFQDKHEKMWIPYDLHVEMYENQMSRFALIKDARGRIVLYYKNDYRTPHSSFFSDKVNPVSSDYKFVGELDTLDEKGMKKIKVLVARSYSRDFKIMATRYAEFHYYIDSVDKQVCDKIISSLSNPLIR